MPKEENEVINYFKKFLSSNKMNIMERCYKTIRDKNQNRYFDDSIKKLSTEEFDSYFPMVSAVILTANKFECDSLNYIFSAQKNSDIYKRNTNLPIFNSNNYCAPCAYIIKYKSFYILHLKAFETGSNTPGGSTDLVRLIINNKLLMPKCIISFGICYGRDPKKQEIGNVLIPKKLYPWSIGQKISENGFKIKHDDFNLNLEREFGEKTDLYSHARTFCDGEDGKTYVEKLNICKMNEDDTNECEFSIKVNLCNMSTGEAVVSSKDLKKHIENATAILEEKGGEMEGYGIAKECLYYADIPCLIIKAICDWGELKNIDIELKKENISVPEHFKDKLQAYAAFCAGICLNKYFDEYIIPNSKLSIIKWMADKKRGGNICNNYNHVDKETIIKNISNFYSVQKSDAEIILKNFIKHNFIELHNSTNTYTTNN